MTDHPHDGAQRRHRTRAEERIAELERLGAERSAEASPADAGTPAATATADVERLRSELEAARNEAAEARASWQRSAADFANYKRRTEQEREAVLGLANESLLRKVLTVVDDFDRALEAMPKELAQLGWIEGVWIIERKLRALLESEGVTPIDAVGQPFDPREHEAIVHQQTTTAPDGTVIAEIQRGYRLRDRVLRPAQVVVANNTGTHAPGGIN